MRPFYEKENYIKAKEQLGDEYAVAYQKAEAYIHLMNHGIEHEENCMMQILDDFLSVQEKERSLSTITGPDLRKFCDTVMKAEGDRLKNRIIFWAEYILAIPLALMLLVLIRSFLFQKNAFTAWNINHLYIAGFDFVYIMMIILALLVKTVTSRIFFHHARIVKIGYIGSFVVVLGIGVYIMEKLHISTSAYISLPFPVFLGTLVLLIAGYAVCIVVNRRNRLHSAVSQNDMEELEEDIPEQVVCPSCGKEHDYDYPRCPHCRHKYIM